MRDYTNIDKYLNELEQDVYPQPEDEGHREQAAAVFDNWFDYVWDCVDVLDVGCGSGFCYEFFHEALVLYEGVHLGEEKENPIIRNMDFSFLSYPDECFDMVFSRHALEHSPFPLLTLMEWHRVARVYLILILPNPEYYTYIGRNHYSVMNKQQIKWLLRRAGWELLDYDYSDETELRFLCIKRDRVGPEGYLEELDNETYERDRDDA